MRPSESATGFGTVLTILADLWASELQRPVAPLFGVVGWRDEMRNGTSWWLIRAVPWLPSAEPPGLNTEIVT